MAIDGTVATHCTNTQLHYLLRSLGRQEGYNLRFMVPMPVAWSRTKQTWREEWSGGASKLQNIL